MKPFLKQVNIVNKPAMTADGEVYTAQKRVQIVQEDSDKFFLTYNHIMGFIYGLESMADVKLMMWLGDNINYNDNTVSLNKFYKERIIQETGMAKSTVGNAITSLTEKGFIVRDVKSPRCAVYHINPSYIFYGDKERRKGKLKFVLEMIQHNNLPDKEREVEDDIRRYEENYYKSSL